MLKPVKTDVSFPKLEEEILSFWRSEKIMKKGLEHNKGQTPYVFYDGPPFATGLPHYGHLLAGTLKDIVPRYWVMKGKYVERRWGWDCHGLPIELKVVKEFPGLKPEELKAKCRSYASEWIAIQKEEFKRLGVVMDWANPYLTMSGQYEADTVRAFGKFVEKGYISRKNKTVSWCASCQTVLAAAEIDI